VDDYLSKVMSKVGRVEGGVGRVRWDVGNGM